MHTMFSNDTTLPFVNWSGLLLIKIFDFSVRNSWQLPNRKNYNLYRIDSCTSENKSVEDKIVYSVVTAVTSFGINKKFSEKFYIFFRYRFVLPLPILWCFFIFPSNWIQFVVKLSANISKPVVVVSSLFCPAHPITAQ